MGNVKRNPGSEASHINTTTNDGRAPFVAS